MRQIDNLDFKTIPPQALDDPVLWFVQYEGAIRRQEFDRVAEAQRQLKRLGYEIRVIVQRPRRERTKA